MVDKLDPNKFHVFSDKQKKTFYCLLAIVVLVLTPLIGFFYYKFAVKRPSQISKELTFEIRRGDSISEVSANLVKEGALNSEFLFNFYVFLNKKDTNIQAGIYTIPAGSSIVDLIDLFQHGTNDKRLTFLEGWRVEEYARLASSTLGHIDYQDFLEFAKTHEGYLFPDTYFLSDDLQEEDLVAILRSTFDEKTAELLTPENAEKTGLTIEQIMIFASIVEREVREYEDQKVVAGILIKRWNEGMQLDADATTQYAVAKSRVKIGDEMEDINWWPNDLTQEELDTVSDYNTRAKAGIPPAPICNPGINSIKAVIENVQTNYYYYLNDASGATYYAETLDQHNENVANYLY